MEEQYGTFATIAQRVVHSYTRSLAEFSPLLQEGLDKEQQAEMEASQRELHAFFRTLYEAIFQHPERFGLPVTEDMFLTGEEKDGTKAKAEINRKLQRSRDSMADGLGFLMLAGCSGNLDSAALRLDAGEIQAYLKGARARKPFVKGLESVGLALTTAGETMLLRSPAFTRMMPALQALARTCAEQPEKSLGAFNFARCDFRTLGSNYHPAALDLYRVFLPTDYARVAQLHAFFTNLGYKPVYQIYGIFGWEVQYQGRRSVKSSPLLRIEYSERFLKPLRINLKCASADRIAPLVYQQPRALQEDFLRRANKCGDCGWCSNKKSLRPSYFELDGVQHKICWYTNGTVADLDDGSVKLIEQYAMMHEALG